MALTSRKPFGPVEFGLVWRNPKCHSPVWRAQSRYTVSRSLGIGNCVIRSIGLGYSYLVSSHDFSFVKGKTMNSCHQLLMSTLPTSVTLPVVSTPGRRGRTGGVASVGWWTVPPLGPGYVSDLDETRGLGTPQSLGRFLPYCWSVVR